MDYDEYMDAVVLENRDYMDEQFVQEFVEFHRGDDDDWDFDLDYYSYDY